MEIIVVTWYKLINNGEIAHNFNDREDQCLNHCGKIIGDKLIKYINNSYKL